jgi:hypothetical protein
MSLVATELGVGSASESSSLLKISLPPRLMLMEVRTKTDRVDTRGGFSEYVLGSH